MTTPCKQNSSLRRARKFGQEELCPLVRRGTGPRTTLGRERSKHNALKHGIFSKVVLLDFEPRSQFDALLRGLRLDLMPEGMLEGILVEKLATIFWRYRRLLQKESAAVQENIQNEEAEKASRSDECVDLEADVERLRAQQDTTGLIHRIGDPHVLESCINKLLGVRMELHTIGLDHETHSILLARVYGARYEGRASNDLLDSYLNCRDAGRASAEERKKRGFSSVEDCLRRFQSELAKEIQRLEGLRKQPVSNQLSSDRTDDELRLNEKELRGCTVPDISELDPLLRYEASLERAFDRALNQLERVQRIRRGQPAAPTMNLRVLA